MNNKLLLTLLLASALIGTACHAHKFQLWNTKLGSTFYVIYAVDGHEISDWQAVTPLKPLSTSFDNNIMFEISTEPRENESSRIYDFDTTPRNQSKTFLLKAFYASPRQGFIVQALEAFGGKRLVNNVSQLEVRNARRLREHRVLPLEEEEVEEEEVEEEELRSVVGEEVEGEGVEELFERL